MLTSGRDRAQREDVGWGGTSKRSVKRPVASVTRQRRGLPILVSIIRMMPADQACDERELFGGDSTVERTRSMLYASHSTTVFSVIFRDK